MNNRSPNRNSKINNANDEKHEVHVTIKMFVRGELKIIIINSVGILFVNVIARLNIVNSGVQQLPI